MKHPSTSHDRQLTEPSAGAWRSGAPPPEAIEGQVSLAKVQAFPLA